MDWVLALLIGVVAGLVGAFIMNRATTVFLNAQSQGSRALEEELRRQKQPEGIELARLEMQERVQHYALCGITGAISAVVAKVWLDPLFAAIIVALVVWLLVDEIMNHFLKLTAPFGAWPLVTHLRGLFGFTVLGFIIGGLLSLAAGQAIAF